MNSYVLSISESGESLGLMGVFVFEAAISWVLPCLVSDQRAADFRDVLDPGNLHKFYHLLVQVANLWLLPCCHAFSDGT